MKLATATRELGQEDAATVANLEKTIEAFAIHQPQEKPEPRSLDRAEERTEVPVGVVDGARLDENLFWQKAKLFEHVPPKLAGARTP